MKYRLIGIDLDGTLLNGAGYVSPGDIAALRQAQAAGAAIVPCTGRAWRESINVLSDIEGLVVGVFVTGAAVTEMATGQSRYLAEIEPHLAYELVAFLSQMPEAVLVFRDANLVGHDYLVAGDGDLTPNTRWWFERCRAKVFHQRQPTADDLHHTLRVGVVAPQTRMGPVLEQVKAKFGRQVFTHHFQAVTSPGSDDQIHVLEVFADGVDKWRGLTLIASEHGIDPSQIAVIGDEINDVSMIRNAACGIAMGNAVQSVKAVADRVTDDNEHAGVAKAVEHLLRGDWD